LAENLPADASWDDVIEEARFRRAVELGNAAADRGAFASDEEVRDAFARWDVKGWYSAGRALRWRIQAKTVGARTLKRTKAKKETQEFSAAVGRALRRVAKAARKTARMYGTPVYVWKNGKVVAEKP
jgi:hypothetical protein